MLANASIEQLDEIYQHFYDCRYWFPHIRKDYVQRNIEAGNVVYDSGVIIIYKVYKRKQRLGTVEAQKGDTILHQILNSRPGTSCKPIMEKFIQQSSGDVWLSVRADNDRACAFYKKCGMELVSDISWMQGKLPGYVFVYKKGGLV